MNATKTYSLEQIEKALQNSGKMYQIQDRNLRTTLIGVRFTDHVWTWFDYSQHTGAIWFNHTYSQNTGRTRRGLAENLAKTKQIEKLLA